MIVRDIKIKTTGEFIIFPNVHACVCASYNSVIHWEPVLEFTEIIRH
jgi:hypothetical protein